MRLDVDVVGAAVILLCKLVLTPSEVVLISLAGNADERLLDSFSYLCLPLYLSWCTQRWRFLFRFREVVAVACDVAISHEESDIHVRDQGEGLVVWCFRRRKDQT